MTEDDEKKIRAIVREEIQAVMNELMPQIVRQARETELTSPQQGISFTRRMEIRELARQTQEEIARKTSEMEALDQEIRERSEKVPHELRPVPEQYKSLSRKKYVLELVKDPTRWSLIPSLSKQWQGVKRNSPPRPQRS